MIIRMTEDRWINFDNVEKIMAFDDVLKVIFNGHENEGVSFYVADKIEGIKVTREISRIMAEANLANVELEEFPQTGEQLPLIKGRKFNEEYIK